MPTTSSSDRYSAVSSSSASSSSSNSCYNTHQHYYHHHHQERDQPHSKLYANLLPLRAATSSFHLSKLNSHNSRSMQSLKLRITPTPIARISPRIVNRNMPSSETLKKHEHSKVFQDDGWLSCDELETIEKRFTDLLQEPTRHHKKSILSIYEPQESRAKSCDRLTINDDNEEEMSKPSNLIHPTSTSRHDMDDRPSNSSIYDNNLQPRPRTVLSANDLLKVESSYRSIGTQVFACRCLCELYITTAERLSKLEDWILFQHGLPVWLLNSGVNSTRTSRFSLILAEPGTGFPLWQDIITDQSDIKQARLQHMTFRFSDQTTLAVLRFHDLTASKEFFNHYLKIRNDRRYEHLFAQSSSSNGHQRSSSCGSVLRNRRKTRKHITKSSISNPCQFQHITSLQVNDRSRLLSLEPCFFGDSMK